MLVELVLYPWTKTGGESGSMEKREIHRKRIVEYAVVYVAQVTQ